MLQAHSFEEVADSVPFLTKQLVQRAAVEDQAPIIAELAGARSFLPSLPAHGRMQHGSYVNNEQLPGKIWVADHVACKHLRG